MSKNKFRLPDFLLVGAMKAGTTTLYFDLAMHESIYLPDVKEPHALCYEDIVYDTKLVKYSSLFKEASVNQLCGEGSTGYTKMPTIEGVASRARRILGSSLKVIYIVREPIERIVSQHRHESMFGEAPFDIEAALEKDQRFLHYSRYAWQLDPWIETFGKDSIHIVVFEQYIKDRNREVDKIFKFLGVGPINRSIDGSVIYNKSDEKPVPKGIFALVQRSGLYRKVIRPMLPHRTRRALCKYLPKARSKPAPPSPQVVSRLLDRLQHDMERIQRILNYDRPVWDINDVQLKWRERYEKHKNSNQLSVKRLG